MGNQSGITVSGTSVLVPRRKISQDGARSGKILQDTYLAARKSGFCLDCRGFGRSSFLTPLDFGVMSWQCSILGALHLFAIQVNPQAETVSVICAVSALAGFTAFRASVSRASADPRRQRSADLGWHVPALVGRFLQTLSVAQALLVVKPTLSQRTLRIGVARRDSQRPTTFCLCGGARERVRVAIAFHAAEYSSQAAARAIRYEAAKRGLQTHFVAGCRYIRSTWLLHHATSSGALWRDTARREERWVESAGRREGRDKLHSQRGRPEWNGMGAEADRVGGRQVDGRRPMVNPSRPRFADPTSADPAEADRPR
ncbi:hypothetical protein DFH06DRAFT_1150558 [Mycena polygramma]|nr:hypothetical protein DFH06DRAFT_1150558 [Mycena polygramma]